MQDKEKQRTLIYRGRHARQCLACLLARLEKAHEFNKGRGDGISYFFVDMVKYMKDELRWSLKIGVDPGDTKPKKTYNIGDSPVVTDLSTDPAVTSLFKGERTGSQALWCLWSYVEGRC